MYNLNLKAGNTIQVYYNLAGTGSGTTFGVYMGTSTSLGYDFIEQTNATGVGNGKVMSLTLKSDATRVNIYTDSVSVSTNVDYTVTMTITEIKVI